jgi:transcriptional regulator with XRE-family HTH domain
MKLTVTQCRAGRALLDWSLPDLAAAAGVGVMTVKRFEAGQTISASSINKLEQAFTATGVALIPAGEVSQDGGDGVRLIKLVSS